MCRFVLSIFVCLFSLQLSRSFCGRLSKHTLESLSREPAIQRFQEYLRIDTSKPENINEVVRFWQRLASEAGLPCAVYEPAGRPVVVISWPGRDPSLPSIMLNSHMDVVPADAADWQYPPFAGHMNDRGDIYGRGAQDTKDVAIAYFEAIGMLRSENITLDRTFHITLMPDEEVGGYHGMLPFIETEEFKDLNVGFALDEGMTSATDILYASFVDRRSWEIKFDVQSEAAHGFTMPDDSAMEKAYKLIDTIMKYRETQKSLMKLKSWLDFGAYNSININMIDGGVAPNVVPARISLLVNMRLSSNITAEEVISLVNSWVETAGSGTTATYLNRVDHSAATAVDDTNRYWVAMRNAAKRLGIVIVPIVCPAVTDSLALRNKGIPALGFSTKSHTISRIHGADEYLNAQVLLKGIRIYAEVFKELGKKESQLDVSRGCCYRFSIFLLIMNVVITPNIMKILFI